MNEDQSYWYERGFHAGKRQAAEAQGYKEAYLALLETIAKNEALLPRQIILTTPQRTWVGLTDEEALEVMRKVPHLTIGGLLSVEAKLKEKNA